MLISTIISLIMLIFFQGVGPLDLWHLIASPSVWPWIFLTIYLLARMILDYIKKNKSSKNMNAAVDSLMLALQDIQAKQAEATATNNTTFITAITDLTVKIADMNTKYSETTMAAIKTLEIKVDTILTRTQDLHAWHSVTDADGVKVWYLRKSLTDYIEKLSENLSKLTEAIIMNGRGMDSLTAKVNELSSMQQELRDMLRDIKRDVEEE